MGLSWYEPRRGTGKTWHDVPWAGVFLENQVKGLARWEEGWRSLDFCTHQARLGFGSQICHLH